MELNLNSEFNLNFSCNGVKTYVVPLNFVSLLSQVRNLKWLGFRVPLAIVNKAHQANQLYPFAISLIESVRTYERTCEKVIDMFVV